MPHPSITDFSSYCSWLVILQKWFKLIILYALEIVLATLCNVQTLNLKYYSSFEKVLFHIFGNYFGNYEYFHF